MEPDGKLFILHLDDRRYALRLAAVERVVRMVEITPLAASDGVLGLINLQGRIVPVLDLRRRLGLPPRPPGAADLLVVAAGGGRTVALVADRVGEIVDPPAVEAIRDPQLFPHMEYLSGVLKTTEGLILLCDLERILTPEEEQAVAEVGACAEGGEGGAAGGGTGDAALQRLLRERAHRLAQEPPQQLFPDEQLEVVEFTLATERYAVESVHVREVYPYRELVRLPGAPDFVMGIMNVRGKIHSVLDIRRFFSLPVRGVHPLSKVIILQSRAMVFGILADSIRGVAPLPLSELQPGLLTATGARASYVRGVTREGVTLLDGAKILSDPKLVVHMEV